MKYRPTLWEFVLYSDTFVGIAGMIVWCAFLWIIFFA